MKKLLFFILLNAMAHCATAQNVGIGTTTPVARLHVTDSSIVFSATGTVPVTPGNTPISGTGRRMMWYADKAALRTGYVSANQWDKDSIGSYSFAAGINTKAKNYASVAMGNGASATGTSSVALGVNSVASGYSAAAVGDNVIASGDWSFASGVSSRATGDGAVAIGNSNIANGFAATAIGDNSIAIGAGSFSTGRSTNAHGSYSVSMGYFSDAFGFGSVALGRETISYGDLSLAIGNTSYATAANSLVVGLFNDTLVTREILGAPSTPSSPLFIIGNGSGPFARKNAFVVRYDGKTAIGVKIPQTLLHQDEGNAIATYHKFTAGTSTGQLSTDGFDIGIDEMGNAELKQRENKHLKFYTNSALRIKVDSSGKFGIGTDLPLALLHIADSSILFSATGNVSALPGNPPITGGGRRMFWYADKAAFRTGYVSSTNWDKDSIGNYSFAAGTDVKAKGSSSVALGNNSQALTSESFAMGNNAVAAGFGARALGLNAMASGDQSTAIGFNTTSSGTYSVALNSNTIAAAIGSIATGGFTISSGDYSSVYGRFTKSKSYTGMVIGTYNDSTNAANPSGINAANRLFQIGNGLADNLRNNAFTVLQNGAIGFNTASPVALIDANGDLALRQNEITVVNGLNDDVSPGTFSFIKITGPTAAFSLSGFTNSVDGKILTVVNLTGQNMTIVNQVGSASAPANRINTLSGADIVTNGNGSVTMQYSIADNRWMVIAVRD